MRQFFYMLIERPIIWLNFMFYRFGMRHGDSDPCAYACFSSVAIFIFNIETICAIIEGIFDIKIPYGESKPLAIFFAFLLILINYLIVYHKKKYKDYFEERTRAGVYQRDKKKFAFCVFGSILLFIAVVSYIRISEGGIENW